MRNNKLFGILILFGILFGGCEKKSPKEVIKIHWDRDMCSRCVMVVSDRHNTVQIKNIDTNKTYIFDDIGCAILWFEDAKIEWKERAQIWITDVDSAKWIDARTAFYDTQNITPMAYGFSAHKTKDIIPKTHEVISYSEVVRRVTKRD